jgi:hypothetical protein
MFPNNMQYPDVHSLLSGARFRHAWIYGDNRANALMINDSDLALAFAIPSFLFSNQPLYLLPSFSLHQWMAPSRRRRPTYPPLRTPPFLIPAGNPILLGSLVPNWDFRVGMFSDFNANSTDSLRFRGWAWSRPINTAFDGEAGCDLSGSQ